MTSFFRTLFTMLVALVGTTVLASIVVIGAAFGIPHRKGGLFDRVPRIWSRLNLWAAGVRVRVHGLDRLLAYEGKGPGGEVAGPYIFAVNHVSLFDIPALSNALPKHYFVAKRELFKVPIFGAGIRAVGTIPIERTNQKSAFGSYAVAAERIRGGSSVVVFPEGTRGTSYPIRPFKKGPFVLAVQAGVPIVPVVLRGTIEVLPKKSFRIRPGRVDVYMLDPIPVAGLGYEDRDAIANAVFARMDAKMKSLEPTT